MRLTIFDQGDSMKAHIRKEKKNGKIYKVCDTVEYDELHTDDEVIKVALSEENMIIGTNFFNTSFVFAD